MILSAVPVLLQAVALGQEKAEAVPKVEQKVEAKIPTFTFYFYDG